jgi:hypothetical protein
MLSNASFCAVLIWFGIFKKIEDFENIIIENDCESLTLNGISNNVFIFHSSFDIISNID